MYGTHRSIVPSLVASIPSSSSLVPLTTDNNKPTYTQTTPHTEQNTHRGIYCVHGPTPGADDVLEAEGVAGGSQTHKSGSREQHLTLHTTRTMNHTHLIIPLIVTER